MSASLRFAARFLFALALFGPLAPLSGCGSKAEPATPARIEGDAATLQFGLRVEAGSGTMVKASEEAVRSALENAGFRLGEEKDADVVLELALSDVDAPQFIQMTVNGKQLKKRAVTAVMKAVGKNGDTLTQKRHTFKVTEGNAVEDDDVRGLVGHFTGNAELNRFGLEMQIERAEKKVKTSPTTAEKRQEALEDDEDGKDESAKKKRPTN